MNILILEHFKVMVEDTLYRRMMFPWQPKVVGLRLLKEERKIVTVGNRLAREKTNRYRLRSGTLSEHSWIVVHTLI